MPQLRSYQLEAKAGVYQAWQQGHKNVALVLPTGAGKTVTMATIINEFPGSVCAIAHRQELVIQISIALARAGVRHRIIGPDNIVKFIVQLHMQETGTSYYNPGAKVAVAGVDTLVRRANKLKHWADSVGLWVQDECFPAGTLIDGRPIESLVVGDTVTAFDEKTGEFRNKKITRLFKNETPRYMMRLTIGHHVLECTQGHPFWTKKGWVNAIDLGVGDEVLYLQQTVRGSESKKEIALFKNGASLLQQGLQQHLQVETFIGNNGKHEPQICFGTHAEKQSNGKSGKRSENVEYIEGYGSSTENQRRKWSGTERSRTNTDVNVWINGVQWSGCYQDRLQGWKWGISAGVQSGLWSLWSEVSNRSGWWQSFFEGTSATRPEKREITKWSRVDCVEIFEPRDSYGLSKSDRGRYVYNIEVEDLHTYVANGVVVHNCHHVLQRNKWGAAAKMFPNARGLGVTATPCRADGYGLGSHSDGVFDTMFVGPSLRWMISEGYLTDYRLFAPPSDMRFDTIEPGASGDYNHKQLRAVAKESHIVGDVVEHYLKLAAGKLGITFAPDIETATEITAQFNAANVPAQLVTGETPDQLRIEYMRRFKQRQLLQLVNVDLFGEGVDVPAVEVVSMARKTESFSLFVQQGGRGLRPVYAAGFNLSTKAGRLAAIAASGKRDAIIIDHVGNIARHAVARDCPYTGRLVADLCHREWSLDRRERRSKGAPADAIPMTHCPVCTGSYPRVLSTCPYCQHKPEPRSRSAPEFVDGDLLELDEAALAKLRGDVAKVDMTPGEYRAQLMDQNVPTVGVMANVKRHVERQGAQTELRELIEQWAGWQKHFGRSRSESYRRFWFNFGIDVMSAQALGVDDARALSIKIIEKMGAE